jgi:hypothetical protein
MHDVFLCHASKDKEELARPLYATLRNAGLNVWFDDTEITIGIPILQAIDNGLRKSRFVLALLSPNFLNPNGRWRWAELEAAMSRELSDDQIRVLPVVCGLRDEEIRNNAPILYRKRYERLRQPGDAADTNTYDFAGIALIVKKLVHELTSPMLLVRDHVDKHVKPPRTRLADAMASFWLLGIDNKQVVGSDSNYIEEALDRGVNMRIICVDPRFPPVVDMVSAIDPRFRTPKAFVDSMVEMEGILSNLRSGYPGKMEFKYSRILPSVGLFITDPKRASGIVKAEIYVPKEWPQLFNVPRSRPHLILPSQMTEWRSYFIAIFQNYWNMSVDPPPEA